MRGQEEGGDSKYLLQGFSCHVKWLLTKIVDNMKTLFLGAWVAQLIERLLWLRS